MSHKIKALSLNPLFGSLAFPSLEPDKEAPLKTCTGCCWGGPLARPVQHQHYDANGRDQHAATPTAHRPTTTPARDLEIDHRLTISGLARLPIVMATQLDVQTLRSVFESRPDILADIQRNAGTRFYFTPSTIGGLVAAQCA